MIKGLEVLEHISKGFIDTDDIETISKELKALEIIKVKEVDIKAFNDLQDLEDYNYYCSPELTQEEYNLLKETLCNTLKN